MYFTCCYCYSYAPTLVALWGKQTLHHDPSKLLKTPFKSTKSMGFINTKLHDNHIKT